KSEASTKKTEYSLKVEGNLGIKAEKGESYKVPFGGSFEFEGGTTWTFTNSVETKVTQGFEFKVAKKYLYEHQAKFYQYQRKSWDVWEYEHMYYETNAAGKIIFSNPMETWMLHPLKKKGENHKWQRISHDTEIRKLGAYRCGITTYVLGDPDTIANLGDPQTVSERTGKFRILYQTEKANEWDVLVKESNDISFANRIILEDILTAVGNALR